MKIPWKRMFVFFLLLLSFSAPTSLYGESPWDVEKPYGPSKTVEFPVKEGTWMNLDVSPDGKEIVFDLLGDIYKIPITGGEAVLLSGGRALEVHPRFSPDGKKILFTSDRGGGDNIWMMNVDGSEKTQITKEDYRLCNNAVWMPDGKYIVAKKHFTSGRSLGAGEMWMYHTTGGAGIRLTARKNDQQDVGEPCVSRDGKYLYFSEDMSEGGYFRYNKNPHEGIYVIRRFCFADGRLENVLGGPGGAVRPQISPDGALMAFVRRVRMKTVLYLHRFSTGEEWPLFDGLSKDQQETWATFGVYPNYNWTPDGKYIVIWAKGKLWKINTETKEFSEIPFQARVKQILVEAVAFPQKVYAPEFSAKMIRHPALSPDGKWLAFSALGHIYLKELPGGTPLRLTNVTDFEYYPDFSPDGKSLVYATWSDPHKGSVRIFSLEKKTSLPLTSEPGYYHSPRFSLQGDKVVYQKGTGDGFLGNTYSREPGLYWISSQGGEAHKITEEGSQPSFNRKGDRVFFQSHSGGRKALKSIKLDGRDIQTLFVSSYATYMILSHDEKWIAFQELFHTYIAPVPPTHTTVEISGNMNHLPVFRLSKISGAYLHWARDSQEIHWLLGSEYFSRKVTDCFPWLSPKPLPPLEEKGLEIGLSAKSDVPQGSLALVGGRIITMKGKEVIEDGVILIDGNRILAVGKKGAFSIPPKTKIIDVQGKTIIPGMIDVHAHLGTTWNGLSPQQQWSYYASLAYGVTTTHDPSAYSDMVFTQSEMVRAGVMVGPRIYSTGTILYGAEGDFKAVVNNIDDARAHLGRMKALGAFSVKSYNQPRRNQRQQVLQAARELKMRVYPEGGSFFFHNFTMILDGHTGIEHSIPVAPLYQDVIQIWSKSNVGYTPTLVVAYGGIWGENYWYQKCRVWENKRLLQYYPRSRLDSRSIRRMKVPEEDYGYIQNARSCKAFWEVGGSVQIGGHGQLHGLDAHWEMWMLGQGGFTPLEALQAATLQGARYLGMDQEIGSIEAGKLADLVVLDKNPLENLQNTDSVRYTMVNGRIYEAETMKETGNYDSPGKKFYWDYEKSESLLGHTDSEKKDACGCCK